MSGFAANLPPFAIVVIVLVGVGCAALVALLIEDRTGAASGRGGLWIFHGEPDAGPHQMAGARDEDRHVIDPDMGADVGSPAPPAQPELPAQSEPPKDG